MSVKKIGQGGEYLYFPVKKKFYSVVFFEIKIVFDFAGFCFQNFIKSKSILSYILRPRLHFIIYNITFFICIIITLSKIFFLITIVIFRLHCCHCVFYYTLQSV